MNQSYIITAETLRKLEPFEKAMAAKIHQVTGADVEVSMRNPLTVYTEDVDKEQAIIDLMSQMRPLIDFTHYEADEDGPAAVALRFSMEQAK